MNRFFSAILPCLLLSTIAGLAQNPGLDAAYQLAWQGKYSSALTGFDHVLRQQPNDLQASLGKAWTLAWKGSFPQAKAAFESVMTAYPGNLEAEKGLAYVALWSGDLKTARSEFRRLLATRPDEAAEWHQAMVQVEMQAGSQVAARKHLDEMPEGEAKDFLGRAIQSNPAYFETQLWGGYSRLDTSSRFGLRALQIAWNPNPRSSAWVRMDNSLTLDHRTLFSRDTSSLAYFAGAKLMPHRTLIVAAEAGQRLIPGRGNQQILSLEPTWYLHRKIAVKTGFLYLNDPLKENQQMAYGGLIWEALPSVWVEPQLFYLWGKPASPVQVRSNLNLKYRQATSGREWNIGATFAPEIASSDPGLGTTFGAWLLYQQPLGRKHWVFALARWERNNAETLTNIAVGLRLRLEQ